MSEWKTKKLSDCLSATKGKKPKVLLEDNAVGFTPYIDIKAFELGVIRQYAEISSSKIATENDILMVWDGARSGLVGNGFDGAIGSTLVALKPIDVDKRYIYHFLSTQYERINTNPKGTGIPHVDPNVLWNIDVSMPSTIEEQQKIVERLEFLLGKINSANERLNKIPSIIKRFRQSVLSAACSGRLTEDWREGKGLTEWKNTILENVCSHIVDCPHSTPKWTSEGKLCVRTTNFKIGLLDLSEKKYVSEETYTSRILRLKPQVDDILYSREGGLYGSTWC